MAVSCFRGKHFLGKEVLGNESVLYKKKNFSELGEIVLFVEFIGERLMIPNSHDFGVRP